MEVAKQRARALREAGLLGEAIAVMREAKRQAKCSASKRVRGETRAGIPKTTVHEQPQTLLAPGPQHEPHPFTTDAADHAETPTEAYRDIMPALLAIASAIGRTPSTLRIWDPYYCQGAARARLGSLGFDTVINRNEDFYEVVEGARHAPLHDILLTNPPYSSSHMERLLRFCATHAKPWILLVPSYVYAKPYFSALFPGFFTGTTTNEGKANGVVSIPAARHDGNAMGKDICSPDPPVLFVPSRRYVYTRAACSTFANDEKDGTSPFPSIWIARLGLDNDALNANKGGSLVVARHVRDIPYQARTDTDPLRSLKRPGNKKRKRLRERAMTAARTGAMSQQTSQCFLNRDDGNHLSGEEGDSAGGDLATEVSKLAAAAASAVAAGVPKKKKRKKRKKINVNKNGKKRY